MKLAYWIPVTILLFRGVVLGYFLGSESFDAKFFTYLNYVFGAFCYLLLIISQWNLVGYSAWVLFLLPLIWGTILFVSFAIIVIVQLNDGVFLKTTVDNDGLRQVGEVHTGDWLLHQLPVFEILLILLLLWPTASVIFRNFWGTLSKAQHWAYSLYFLLAPLLVLAFYMINVDFDSNYPTKMNHAATVALVIVLALLTQLLLYAIFRNADPATQCSHTPVLVRYYCPQLGKERASYRQELASGFSSGRWLMRSVNAKRGSFF